MVRLIKSGLSALCAFALVMTVTLTARATEKAVETAKEKAATETVGLAVGVRAATVHHNLDNVAAALRVIDPAWEKGLPKAKKPKPASLQEHAEALAVRDNANRKANKPSGEPVMKDEIPLTAGEIAEMAMSESRAKVDNAGNKKPRVINACFGSLQINTPTGTLNLNTLDCENANSHLGACVQSAATPTVGCEGNEEFCCAEITESFNPGCPEITVMVDGAPITGRFVVSAINCWQ